VSDNVEKVIHLRHSLTQAHCQVAHTTCFGPTLITCCAYSWVSTVFLEILSFPFDSPSFAANYVAQLDVQQGCDVHAKFGENWSKR
jgi:hypothetical protein